MSLSESKADHEVRVLEVLVDRVSDLENRVNDAALSVPGNQTDQYSAGAGI